MASELNPSDRLVYPPEPERPDRSDKVAQRVARLILRDIVARSLAPGTKLPPEASMLQRYEVGRASLREGLRILEVYGLIWIKPGPGGGPVVADVSSVDFGRSSTFFYHAIGATLHELVEARVHLEPLMARLAAERLSDETAATLRQVLEYEESLTDAGSSGPQELHSNAFHNVVASMGGNNVIGLFSQSLTDIYIDRIRPIFGSKRRQALHGVHSEIGRAILKGQATRAERLMRDHLEYIAEEFARYFPMSQDEIIDWR